MNTVRYHRQARRLTLQALAKRAQTSVSTLIYIEKYGHTPRPELCQRIALALAVPAEELWPEGESNSGGIESSPGRDT
jgi:transcriptional regulator with XRE-family HTH domain